MAYSSNRLNSRSGFTVTYWRRQFGFWLSIGLLVIASIITAAPIVWTVSASLQTPAQAFDLPPTWFPPDPHWENYAQVFNTIPFMTYIFNSTIVTLGIVVGQVITATLAGYAFARLPMPGRNRIILAYSCYAYDPLSNYGYSSLCTY